MLNLTCPVCGGELMRAERTLRCAKGHCYDIAKQNYVNLRMRSQSSKKRHGDDQLMVRARQRFLDAGWYAPLRDALCALAAEYAGGGELLDAGCGEGYYTSAVRAALTAAGKDGDAVGIDISRTALIAAAKRDTSLKLAVAGVNALPVPDASADVVLNIFAPNDDAEFARVLRPGGLLLKAVPLERHLFGLKAAVYDKPYLNPAPDYAPEGFALLERRDVVGEITVAPQEMIEALFMMTPYYYKTGAADQAKLRELRSLTTEIAFGVLAFRSDK